MNELVNSIIESSISDNIYGEGALFGTSLDFRKRLYISTCMARIVFASEVAGRAIVYGSNGFRIYALGVLLTWTQPDEFLKLDVVLFKEVSLRLTVCMTKRLLIAV